MMSRRNFIYRVKQCAARLILSCGLVMAMQVTAQASQNVTLAWNPNPNVNIAGYKIYYGVVSHSYTNSVNVGNTTSATISLSSPGTTYYFAATAYDSSGNESGYSNETAFTVPLAATLAAAGFSSGHFSFTVAGTAGSQYVVEASTNLTDWFPMQTNTAPFTFWDTNPAGLPQCFYRSVPL